MPPKRRPASHVLQPKLRRTRAKPKGRGPSLYRLTCGKAGCRNKRAASDGNPTSTIRSASGYGDRERGALGRRSRAGRCARARRSQRRPRRALLTRADHCQCWHAHEFGSCTARRGHPARPGALRACPVGRNTRARMRAGALGRAGGHGSGTSCWHLWRWAQQTPGPGSGPGSGAGIRRAVAKGRFDGTSGTHLAGRHGQQQHTAERRAAGDISIAVTTRLTRQRGRALGSPLRGINSKKAEWPFRLFA